VVRCHEEAAEERLVSPQIQIATLAKLHPMRDTDADWRKIGANEPFWGVYTAAQFKPENLNPQAVATFYASGVAHMKNVTARLERIAGKPIRLANALDFGCGTGRLSEAMGNTQMRSWA
jgi:2-polyprenyl-3-methyl-5-hydroxy-6-metoxy-1,4-benzoquinol methylase